MHLLKMMSGHIKMKDKKLLNIAKDVIKLEFASLKKLHSNITVIILLSLAHYFFHKAGKNDFFWPFIATAVFVILYVAKKWNYSGVKKSKP